MESTLVIKAKYGDTLRRFNAPINENGLLDLDMNGFRAKILGLFSFPLDADVILTYVDEDGDVVTLVDDDDLVDVMKQSLKFLRVDVYVNYDKVAKSNRKSSSGTSTPIRSPQSPFPNLNAAVAADVLKSVPEPLRQALSKLSLNLPSRSVCTNPVVHELVDCLSKLGLSYLIPAQQSRSGASTSIQTGTVDPVTSAVPTVPNVATNCKTSQEAKVENVTRGVGVCIKPVPAPVDLNLDLPCDSNLSGCETNNFEPKVNNDGRKQNKKQNFGHPSIAVRVGAPSSTSDSARPFGHKCPFGGVPLANDSSAPPLPPRSFGGVPLANDSSAPPLPPRPFGVVPLSNDSSAPPLPPRPFGVVPLANDSSAPSLPSDSARPFGNKWPFGGVPLENDSSAPPLPPQTSPCRRSSGRNDPLVGIFHKGVQCDGCGIHPITGPRYKSKVRDDYDLCSICFSEMGNEADYIKIGRPVSYRHSQLLKGLQDPNYWVGPPQTHVMRAWGKLDSLFVLDVNVLDGTMMAPSTPFTKIWRLRNNGAIAWPRGSRLVWTGGHKFSHADSVKLEIPAGGLPVNGEIDVAVDFTSPKVPERYISYWKMATPAGAKFGQRVWVVINVVDPMEDSVSDGVRDLNLNFPPDFAGSECREVIDVNVQPVMDSGNVEPCNSTSTSASVSVPRPIVDIEQQQKDQERNFTINDCLLVGNGVSTPASPQVSPPVSYPIVDFFEAGPSEAAPAVDVPTSSEETDVKDVEKSLLKELEEMGFRQVDLNKEILRLNEYNLEQSVDDLCGVSEWDPILEELQEMGFKNEEINRKLLKKNNGSIKGVVMDLLTGEKA